jgi:hypothetical protein
MWAGKCQVVSFDDGVRFLGETVTAWTLNSAETLSHHWDRSSPWNVRAPTSAPAGTVWW